MRKGKLSETELKRSVLKQIHKQRVQAETAPSVFPVSGHEDAAWLGQFEGSFCCSVSPVTEGYGDPGRAACRLAANNLYASGAVPAYYLCTFLFPLDTPEEQVREAAAGFGEEAACQGAVVAGGHTERTDAVSRPVLSISAVGKKNPHGDLQGSAPGQDLVITKTVGLQGTALLARKFEKQLRERFPSFLVDRALGFEETIGVGEEADAALAYGAGAMHDFSRGGVFGGLWEFAENCGLGLMVDLRKIPLRQETVEICDFLECNPYELLSGGSLLLSCEDGEGMVRHLEETGIPAAIIGRLSSGNDRILLNEGETRYLDKPKEDAFFAAAATPQDRESRHDAGDTKQK